MDAITLLKREHREVEALFDQFKRLADDAPKAREAIFEMIADALAVHTQIEERIFYPAAKFSRTESLLHHSVEEHLEVKRLLAELLERDPHDPAFDSGVASLQQAVEKHVREEEEQLFPLVSRQLGSRKLEALGSEMERVATELDEHEPRSAIPGETAHPAPI